MDGFFESQRYAAMKNLNSISAPVKRHIRQVYWTLGTALIAAALGVYVDMILNIGGILTALAFIGTAMWIHSSPPLISNENSRWNGLMAVGFLYGATAGDLVQTVLAIDPRLVLVAFIGTVIVFGCLSAAALVAPRREYMFLGGLLGSAISLMLWIGMLGFFFEGIRTLELYAGLMVFCGYVLFDTQFIIERADRGDYDYIKHSLDLFVDFVAILVRLLVILAKNAEKQEEKPRRKRRE